ncbi:MAG: DUF6058 family natural product biosynthesis protein [Colwellia sp.]|nr:DUF6058 family natural product biosynthesis protein [Colwellia sp.]
MQLINYLHDHFLTRVDLLTLSATSNDEFELLQRNKLMPACSYKLEVSTNCNSFFGEHHEQQTVEYYSKGYSSWLGILHSIKESNDVFQLFSKRYKQKLVELKRLGITSKDNKVNAGIDQHISEEWQYFINGTYGLCTKSGLPECIAAKEIAILIINELTDNDNLANDDLMRLTQAVNLLDSVSALFAPHERENSSRERLVNKVRQKYQLVS